MIQNLLIALCLFATSPLAGGGDEKAKQRTELHLKPNVTARGLHVTIGDLCDLVPGDTAGLALTRIRFSQAPALGHGRTVTRTEIVQSLAAAGVELATVKLTGAEEIMLQSIAVEIPGQELLDAALAALQAQLAVEGGDVEVEAPARLRSVQAPPGRDGQDLRARVRGPRTGPNSAVVDVEILVDGENCRAIPLTFKLQRFQPLLKTIGPLRAGSPLGPDSLALVREPLAQASAVYLNDMSQIEGLVAARSLTAGQRLTLNDVAPPALVHRGDVVTVVLNKGRVKVTTKALANHDAPLGGRVTVTNTQSRSQLTGFVHGPGLVVVAP
jgi:flagellar basal body P-ring formation protein FlgA